MPHRLGGIEVKSIDRSRYSSPCSKLGCRNDISTIFKVNIWDDIHMGKIIPSLLYNIDVQAGR